MDSIPEAIVNEKPRSTVALLHEVYKLYRDYYWRWFGICAPSSLLAAAVLMLNDQVIRNSFQGILRQFPPSPSSVMVPFLLRLSGFFIAWLLGCFALGAIASVVHHIVEGDWEAAGLGDGYQKARERIRPLLAVSAFTFCVFLCGLAAISLVEFAASQVLRTHYLSFYMESLVGYILVAGLLSWFGMAIPLVVNADVGAWPSLKQSWALSDGKEAFLFLLVLESIAGSYLAIIVVHYLFGMLPVPNAVAGTLLPWITLAAGVLASAAVQPPLFIGLSLVALSRPVPAQMTHPSSSFESHV